MKATLLLTRINQRLGTEINLSKFFETPTIKGVGDTIELMRARALNSAAREAVIEDFI